jgi:hypothetical protein
MTDGTLVADAADVGGVGVGLGTKRAITADANMNSLRSSSSDVGKVVIDGNEPMVRVDEAGVLVAAGAVVPVRAVQTLVTNAGDILVTAITDGMMKLVASSAHLDLDVLGHHGAGNSGDESVLGVVAMTVLGEAWLAEIEIIAGSAVKEL